jgi:hypothetical protein
MEDEVFINSVRLRLGLPLLGISGVQHCTCQSNAIVDKLGDHLLSCASEGLRIERHDLLVKTFYKYARYAGLNASTQTSDLQFEGVDSGIKVDLVVFNPQFVNEDQQQHIKYDVTVVHPCCVSSRAGQAAHQGHAIEQAEAIKRNKYGQLCHTEGMLFRPLVFETFGNWSKDVQDLIGHLAKKISTRSGIPLSVIQHSMELDFSTKLHSYNAYICLLRNVRLENPGGATVVQVTESVDFNREFVEVD